MADRRFYQGAAKAAWVAPPVAGAFAYCAMHGLKASGQVQPSAAWMVMAVTVLMVLAGLVAGIVALGGVRAHGRRGVLVPALIGVMVNGLIILSGAQSLHLARTVSAARAVKVQQARAAAERDGVTSMLGYPGWIGAVRTPFGKVALASVADQSPSARRMLGNLGTRCSVVSLVIDNSGGARDVEVEPSSLRLRLANGRTVQALDSDAVLSTAREDRESARRLFGGAHRAQARRAMYETVCFIPAGVDLQAVQSASIQVDGSDITVPCRFMSVEEKRKAFDPLASFR